MSTVVHRTDKMMDKYNPPYLAMLAQSPDSLIFADCDGIIRYWNAASTALFGFRADEALGRSLDIIIPEHLRAPHWHGFHAAIHSRTTKHGGKPTRTKALHRDGSHLYAQVSFSLIKDDTGKVLGSLSSARDGLAIFALLAHAVMDKINHADTLTLTHGNTHGRADTLSYRHRRCGAFFGAHQPRP